MARTEEVGEGSWGWLDAVKRGRGCCCKEMVMIYACHCLNIRSGAKGKVTGGPVGFT
jgi:hypothetical protein